MKDQFLGYPRRTGQVGTRNYLAVIPTVFCANEVAWEIANKIKNARALLHHQGCAQLKPDADRVTQTLIGLGTNPNVGAVLLVGLGCESVSLMEVFKGIRDRGQRAEKVNIQSAGGMKKAIQRGLALGGKLHEQVAKAKRKPALLSSLVMGIKCGSSDAYSGLTSNPAVGAASDLLLEKGGTVLFGETTEFLGAEHLLARRSVCPEVGKKIIEIVLRMENRIAALGFDMRGGNPTPGNIRGGLTTIEEKSLGAICKSGTRPIDGVLEYGQSVSRPGLFVLDSPGQEAVANVIVFSTGGGAPQGYPLVPVIKVAGNPQKCRDMKDHIDLDVSGILQGTLTIPRAAEEILAALGRAAGGQKVKAESLKYDQTVEIYTTGPTL
ncbi:MAG: carbohydrate hydrolase [Deltaproteobacteria bacterium]|nr:carbohydrate hydrolase [Deltaproteobacteria bacterium]